MVSPSITVKILAAPRLTSSGLATLYNFVLGSGDV